MNRRDIEALGKPDPDLEEYIKKHGALPAIMGSVGDFRAGYNLAKAATMAAAGVDAPWPGMTITNTTVEARDGFAVPIRIYLLDDAPPGPLVVWFHGGAFCLGDLDLTELSLRNLVRATGCTAVSVDYRLAPEHTFPTPVHDCWDVTQWVAANAATVGADLAKGFVVGGASAGSNLADVVAHLARDEKLAPPLTGLVLSLPIVLPAAVVPEKYRALYFSHEQNAKSSIFNEESVKWMEAIYKADVHSPLYASFNWPSGHAGLPPVYMQVCGADPMRDEGLVYERVLREEVGVSTKLDIYAGLPHGFAGMYKGLKKSVQWEEDFRSGVKWLLAH